MDRLPATVKHFILAAALVTAACSNPAPAEPSRSAQPLANTFASPEALARGVLDALATRDRERLNSIALSEVEFRTHVWPELPASRPERNLPFEYAWGQMKQRSDGSLQSTIGRYAGRRLAFVRTRFTGETTKYASFEVMRESEIIAADESGRELILRLYGSAMVINGRYKLFSYVVDD